MLVLFPPDFDETEVVLNYMIKEGLVEKHISDDGEELYNVTDEGLDILDKEE